MYVYENLKRLILVGNAIFIIFLKTKPKDVINRIDRSKSHLMSEVITYCFPTI